MTSAAGTTSSGDTGASSAQAFAAEIGKLPTFEIDAEEGMTYHLPITTAPAGAVVVELQNNDTDMPHEADLFKLHDGVTTDQFKQALMSAGDAGAAMPKAAGKTLDDVTNYLKLPPGQCLLVCFVDDPKTHMPLFAMGMLTPITVS